MQLLSLLWQLVDDSIATAEVTFIIVLLLLLTTLLLLL